MAALVRPLGYPRRGHPDCLALSVATGGRIDIRAKSDRFGPPQPCSRHFSITLPRLHDVGRVDRFLGSISEQRMLIVSVNFDGTISLDRARYASI